MSLKVLSSARENAVISVYQLRQKNYSQVMQKESVNFTHRKLHTEYK